MNAPIQKPANKKYIRAYLVLLSHLIEAKGEPALGVIVPTLYKNLKQRKITVKIRIIFTLLLQAKRPTTKY